MTELPWAYHDWSYEAEKETYMNTVATQLIESMIAKAEADIEHYASLISDHVIPQGDDVNLRARVLFHEGQVSGLRHALFALRHGGENLA